MEVFQFVFWEAIKALGLAFLGLVALKSIGALRLTKVSRLGLYALVLALAAFGARGVGEDVASEVSFWLSTRDLNRSDIPRAYLSALRAVQLRPSELRYWQALARAKLSGRQFQSLAADEPAFRELEGAATDEDDLLRFATCHYFLRQYDQVIPLTRRMIAESSVYPEAYVLEGLAYSALEKYPEAERDFLEALRLYPSQSDAVEGLAQAYFLSGETGQATAVLEATEKYPFPPEVRKHFAALKELYEQ